MLFTVLTLFPEMFPGPLGLSLSGKARQKGLWDLHILPIRAYAEDKHETVDDASYGGGTGLVMRADVLDRALSAVCFDKMGAAPIFLYPSPRGKRLEQADLQRFVSHAGPLVILCGRYEGVDQRLLDVWGFEEVSLGDFVLAGGEIPALALMEGCIRLLPGVMGTTEGLAEESFSNGLLEYPHYTRPQEWRGHAVPEILRSGHHQEVAKWRLQQSETLTEARRPDLWERYQNSKS